jgi:hypothetical protein
VSNARQNGRDLFSARRGLLAALRRIYNSGADAGNPILAKKSLFARTSRHLHEGAAIFQAAGKRPKPEPSQQVQE